MGRSLPSFGEKLIGGSLYRSGWGLRKSFCKGLRKLGGDWGLGAFALVAKHVLVKMSDAVRFETLCSLVWYHARCSKDV